uniref:Pepsin-I3 domain-containing protein n=1 Tax=Angiostrongylus cantonensis TaxID=6313 RepID=A0A0K0DHQ0_ANGCA
MVPNNEVYVGQTYARDQTPTEIYELKMFEKKHKVYQEHIQMQVQVSDLFMGSDFFPLFFCGESNETTTAEVAMAPEEASEQPTIPNFCTSIY